MKLELTLSDKNIEEIKYFLIDFISDEENRGLTLIKEIIDESFNGRQLLKLVRAIGDMDEDDFFKVIIKKNAKNVEKGGDWDE